MSTSYSRSIRRRRAACGAVTFCLSWAALPVLAADPDEKAPAPARPSVTRGPVAKIDGPYRLQPGDELEITVTPRNEYSCRGVVLPDGMIYLKNVGSIKAGEMTIDELQKRIVTELKQTVRLKNPSVSINPVRLADQEKKQESLGKITVAGAVGRQGPLDLEPGLRLRKAIDIAGAMKDADLKHVKIVHADLRLETVDLSSDASVTDPKINRLLLDGDSINIPSLRPEKEVPDTVSIDGAVTNPAPYPLDPSKLVTLQDLIQASGRMTPLADYKKVELRREGQPDQVFDLEALEKKGLQGRVELKPGDKVFVPTQNDRVYLLGAVQKPGAYGLVPGQRVSDFFFSPSNPDVAGALGQSVDMEHVQLIRQGKEAIQVNLKTVIKNLTLKDRDKAREDKNNVALLPGDAILLLPRNERTRKSPFDYLSQLGGLASLFTVF